MTLYPTPEDLSQADTAGLRKACLEALVRQPGQKMALIELASWLQMRSTEDLSELCATMPEWLRLEAGIVSLRGCPDWLDAERIQNALGELGTCLSLNIALSTGSTNQDVLDRLSQDQHPDSYIACLAEMQHAGRGRRGRQWHSGIGNALLCSIGWHQRLPNPHLALIPLVMGLVVAETLKKCMPTDVSRRVRVKWPNDVYIGDAKLAGLLVESKPLSDGKGMAVVVGVGLNLRVEEAHIPSPAQKTTSLHRLMDSLPDRNLLVGQLLKGFMQEQIQVLSEGFVPYASRWSELDYLGGKAVKVLQVEKEIQGVARGVSVDGNLLIEVDGELCTFYSGEVSVRRRF